MHRPNRDDLPTLRVTNLSEDAQEGDLWDLFNRFGRISRIYVGKDQETGLCKGFAFVSFEDRSEAEKAMKKIDGLPYDHLILGWCAPISRWPSEKLTLWTVALGACPVASERNARTEPWVFASYCLQVAASELCHRKQPEERVDLRPIFRPSEFGAVAAELERHCF